MVLDDMKNLGDLLAFSQKSFTRLPQLPNNQ